ncbi:hypothetical protein N8I77_011291 [Diaporthe amygdali]|uniref:non-specific serine/threonine protein kinase n=1 Tax=Phomopsis amygdali TaxID=1214568 RepID=A0AAD9S554_PHOAM|nr:hypothetical protein N8I77_011291 [Diaporthe amygdali]
MSTSTGGPGQSSIDDRDLETRIEDCLNNVLSPALDNCARRSGRIGVEEKSFFCRSDLEKLWNSESRLIDVVFGHLSNGQRRTLLRDLLLFISFLVSIDVRPSFILACKSVLFKDPESTASKFKDDDGPRSQADLQGMGLTLRQARFWKEQYRFRPAKITFATERWEPQRIDPLFPLPFETVDDVQPGVIIHGGFGDDAGYGGEYGTVRLYRIPREYIENEIRALETWEPTGPLLRIVKSFSVRQSLIEEAKNMELLKQSLVTHLNISIHDAIIEQKQEDDTGIVSIVSPYASLGDLAQFLAGGYGIMRGHWDRIYDMDEKFPRATDTHQLRMCLLGQSKNLAEALEFLHNGFKTQANDWKIKCAHLDLKPSNILIFESTQRDEVVGNWKLCDFGISVFGAEHLHGSPNAQLGSAGDFFMKLERTIRTSPKRIPGVYQAPEIEHPHLISDGNTNPEHGARTSDIWSFGAIFAEILAYAQGGAFGVKRFDQKRRRRTTIQGELVHNDFFYTTLPDHMRRSSSTLPYILRREVSLWLEEFTFDHQSESEPSGACLRCWAECVKNILEVDARYRPSATTLYQWIADLRRHATDPRLPHVRFRGPDHPSSLRPEPDDEDSGNISTPAERPVYTPPNTLGGNRIAELPLSSRDVIDYDLDGHKLVYLTKTSIDLFNIDSPRPYPEVEQLQNNHNWHAIKVTNPYVVVWGSNASNEPQPSLRVYNISNGQISRAQSSAKVINFNVTRRVALSRQGYIAIIHNDEILILDVNDKALPVLSRIEMVWQYPAGKFVDIAFDDSGSTLYAWGNQELYGVLCAYSFEGAHGHSKEVFRARYKNSFGEHKTLILPFDKHRDLTPSRKDSSSTGSEGLTPQRISEHPDGYHAWAACTVGDSMLLVGATKKRPFSHRKVGISEQIIGPDGKLCFSAKSSDQYSLETKTPWSALHNPGLNTDVKVGTIPSNGAAEEHKIVVYYKKGVLEVLPLIQS